MRKGRREGGRGPGLALGVMGSGKAKRFGFRLRVGVVVVECEQHLPNSDVLRPLQATLQLASPHTNGIWLCG